MRHGSSQGRGYSVCLLLPFQMINLHNRNFSFKWFSTVKKGTISMHNKHYNSCKKLYDLFLYICSCLTEVMEITTSIFFWKIIMGYKPWVFYIFNLALHQKLKNYVCATTQRGDACCVNVLQVHASVCITCYAYMELITS